MTAQPKSKLLQDLFHHPSHAKKLGSAKHSSGEMCTRCLGAQVKADTGVFPRTLCCGRVASNSLEGLAAAIARRGATTTPQGTSLRRAAAEAEDAYGEIGVSADAVNAASNDGEARDDDDVDYDGDDWTEPPRTRSMPTPDGDVNADDPGGDEDRPDWCPSAAHADHAPRNPTKE